MKSHREASHAFYMIYIPHDDNDGDDDASIEVDNGTDTKTYEGTKRGTTRRG